MELWMQIFATVVGSIVSAGVLAFLLWLKKSYDRFCSMDASLQEIKTDVLRTYEKLSEHEERLDHHDSLLGVNRRNKR